MSVTYQEPVTTVERGETIEEHPSYAQISASRVSGHAVLYGSDFVHQHYVTVRIHASKLRRSLSMDWPHSGKEYIEVMLSEAQWATFVSSLNVGSGPQCTLLRKDGQSIPQLPEPPKRHEQFAGEMDDHLKEVVERLQRLRNRVADTKMTMKAHDELLALVDSVHQSLKPNLKFVADQFGEYVENTTERAKMEVNAYIQVALQRAGVKALAEQRPLMLGDGSAVDGEVVKALPESTE